MKVALAINYDYHDYGGMLQAFATQRFLEKHGVDSDAVNFDNVKGDINKRKWYYFLSNILDVSIVKEKSKLIEKRIRQKFNSQLKVNMAERDAAFDEFCSTHFKVSRTFVSWNDMAEASRKEYDAVVVGSDQLWLPSNVKADYYTLNWVPDDVKKIAYATSFGIGKIPNKYKKEYSIYLNRMNYLSARETSGQEIIKELTDKDVPLVNDPALLLDADGWNEIVKAEPLVKDKYVFCYFMGNNPEQRGFVKRLAKEKNLKVVALLHLDQYIATDEEFVDIAPWHVSPADFVNLVKNAECVCTDSFHGTVFSIIYSRPFFTFKRFNKKASLSTNTRITSLLTRLGLMDRLVLDMDSKLAFDIDWKKIQSGVSQFRKASSEYLLKAIRA
jgi:hypothetical protein